jgi:hypothetical protein
MYVAPLLFFPRGKAWAHTKKARLQFIYIMFKFEFVSSQNAKQTDIM